MVLGTDLCPDNGWQYFSCYSFLHGRERFHNVGLAAIWFARYRATFEHKIVKTPFEIIFSVLFSHIYWAGLQKPGMEEMVKKGAEMLKANTTQMMLLCGPPPAPNTDGHDCS